jgi:hypothetical protein
VLELDSVTRLKPLEHFQRLFVLRWHGEDP